MPNEISSETRVRIRNLSKSFGKAPPVLGGIDLEIESREFVVLVGPSGCGKSTLLRLIAGLEVATSGEIWIGGRQVNELPGSERGIAMVFQDYALYPHMTVAGNLGFGLKMRGRGLGRGLRKDKLSVAEQTRRIALAADLLGLEKLMDRKPSELSGGQRQRVAIGRALVKEPRVFLFDEPLSNLDAQLRAETRLEIAALHRKLGSISIYVTHDQLEAMTLADRLVVLKDGKIQQQGRPLDLYRNPSNRFVASFLGTPGMNFLDEVESKQGVATLGIRPEAIRALGSEVLEGTGAGFFLAGQVLFVEAHGHEVHLVVQVGQARWIVRAAATELKAGDPCRLELDRNAIYWFDAQGKRIRDSGEK